MITRHIANLLYHNECVIVPGLGGFIKAFSPARIVQTMHQFYPPSGKIAFNASLSGNDGILANYIANAEKITYREAIFEISKWVDSCYVFLNNNEKLVLNQIGELYLNDTGNIEFTPSDQINFNIDSFGLPVFIAKPVTPVQVETPEVQVVKRVYPHSKIRALIPETLKWAAVLAPFITFGLWSSFNGEIVNNYVHNYTGMFSWVRSTPGKTAPIAFVPSIKKISRPANVISPVGILAEEHISFEPNVLSYNELTKLNIKIADTTQISKAVEIIAENQNYHIIGGAFRDHNNAVRLVAMLQKQGFPAEIIDTTRAGLFVVSMKGFYKLEEATHQLDEIKKAGFPTSWILKKNRL